MCLSRLSYAFTFSKTDLQGFAVEDRIESTVKALKNVYSCNIRGLDDRLLRNIMFENKSGKIWTNFTKCYISVAENKLFIENLEGYLLDANGKNFDKHANIFRYLHTPGYRADFLNSCLQKLERKCRTAKLRVTKVLRLSLRLVPRLLNLFPKLKILFVLRDPRGIVNSRIQTDWFPVTEDKPAELIDNIKSLCVKMETDINMVQHLKRNFPDRVIDFRLEDITENSIATYEAIFKLMNTAMTDVYREKVMKIFVSKPKFQTKWIVSLKGKYIKLTEKLCAKVFEIYKYFRLYS